MMQKACSQAELLLHAVFNCFNVTGISFRKLFLSFGQACSKIRHTLSDKSSGMLFLFFLSNTGAKHIL